MLNTSLSAAEGLFSQAADSDPDVPVSLDDVYRAREVIAPHLAPTPLISHPMLSAALGCDAHVKLENTHSIGSFKIRGSLNLLAGMDPARRRRGLVTATKGNHGQSLALAARRHGVACTIFVPERNNEDKNRAMAALGAEVVVQGHDFDAAWHAAERFADRTGATAVHPAREAALVAGVGTVALEMIEQADGPLDAVYVPVGGGSLAAGIAVVFKACSPETRLIGVQTENAPAMHHAWHTDERRPFVVTHTVADGLAVRVPVDFTLGIMQRLLDDMVLVSEDEIYHAMRLYAGTIHQMAEGAGAVPLAGALAQRERLDGRRVGLVLSGGNVEAHVLAEALTGAWQPLAPQALPMFPMDSLEYGY